MGFFFYCRGATTDQRGAIGSSAAKSEMACYIETRRRMRQFGFGRTTAISDFGEILGYHQRMPA